MTLGTPFVSLCLMLPREPEASQPFLHWSVSVCTAVAFSFLSSSKETKARAV